jgi:predicted transcriptional regulator
MIKLSVQIEDDLNRRLRLKLIDDTGRSQKGLSEFVANAIREKLDREDQEGTA